MDDSKIVQLPNLNEPLDLATEEEIIQKLRDAVDYYEKSFEKYDELTWKEKIEFRKTEQLILQRIERLKKALEENK